MTFLRRFLIRLLNRVTGRSVGQRLQEEIAEHMAFQTEENMRAGMSPTEARRQAALKLGAAEARSSVQTLSWAASSIRTMALPATTWRS